MLDGTGWVKGDKDERDYTPETKKVKPIFDNLRSNKLPEKVDLREFCSPIEDQGSIGSCTAMAAVGAAEFLDNIADKVYLDKSKMFEYYNVRKEDGTLEFGDCGGTIRSSIKALVDYGVCLEDTWEYKKELLNKEPDEDAYREGGQYKALTYVSLSSVDDIKATLNGKIPVNIGFYVFQSIYDSNSGDIPYPSLEEVYLGGHAVLLVGYDDNKEIKNRRTGEATVGAFLIRNSWGTRWGELGYGWLPYDYIQDGLADDFWAILSIDGSENPAPRGFIDKVVYYLKIVYSKIRMFISGVI